MTVAVIVGKTGMSEGRRGRDFSSATSPPRAHPLLGTGWRVPGERTEFDRKAGREFHLNELSQFVEMLEWGDDLQHVQQPGGKADGRFLLVPHTAFITRCRQPPGTCTEFLKMIGVFLATKNIKLNVLEAA